MPKYLDDESLTEISKSIQIVKSIRNDILKKYGVDILENDTISLSTFVDIIKKIDPNYNCNFDRNGNDGETVVDGKSIGVESKTTKVTKTKTKGYTKTSFAFHAKGLINHETYLFSTWDKNTLEPISSYYVRDPNNVKLINEELKRLSDEWESKPLTKAGYDVIRINEDMLIDMVKSTKIVDNCKVFLL